ncbi:selenocysteine-specific translation elongation factor [Aquibacillus rhizosphaerae]|uniref:Selenocysteine-specific elongation factor n=1 Tax=Aquibacillus rhizosphaerae TaxID=3051431 RepID=A0ABT7L8S8_9BACI|nr:selenocysteine-specific translation elongation factor [Aquibacillus sp. LR5S19]MDL4842258.1 selenocysteine-specific translation elongation factor [Aquibacillus sp. LR5S19]
MDETFFTIGMAGHIDHGKTSLTKALTNIDTDRLKEEKERSISIELGYAPLHTKDNVHVSIVDVPGHERFIRQMIAGVAGIDLVILVVAAEEGVMPQTQEHIEILEFLGIKRCIVAITKMDRVDEELLELVTLDIQDVLSKTVFYEAPMVQVDSISGKGIEQLKEKIYSELKSVQHRDLYGSFRLPIDQVFTAQGQGTIVRGTVYEGIVENGSMLTILPKNNKVKARNIQVHHKDVEHARAGQRAAINISGLDKNEVNRGDVLVASNHFLVTETIDVSLQFVSDLRFPIKQRAPVKIHVGTSEVMGKIVFFDRNEVLNEPGEIVCQLRLDEEIVVRRGDRFILRRPTPVETIGGGWIVEPNAGKYRFGKDTIKMLETKREGTPEDRIIEVLMSEQLVDKTKLIQTTSLEEVEVERIIKELVTSKQIIEILNGKYALVKHVLELQDLLLQALEDYHESHPMQLGENKAELIQIVRSYFPKQLIEYALKELLEAKVVKKVDQFIAKTAFHTHLPEKWKTRMEEIISKLKADGLSVQKWEDYTMDTPLSEQDSLNLKKYLVQTNQAYLLTEELLVHKQSFDEAVDQLRENTSDCFNLKQVKTVWNVSRKYLIPLLELLDHLQFTERNESERCWLAQK